MKTGARMLFHRRGTDPRGDRAPLLTVAATVMLFAAAASAAGIIGAVGDAISQGGPLVPLFALLLLALRHPASHRQGNRWWTAALALLALALTAALVRPLLQFWPTPSGADRAVRIVEFNSWLENRAPLTAVRWIRAQRPDVVVLLEGADRSAPIARALARDMPYRTSCNLNARCSTLILSRLPPIERRGLAHGDADNRRALSAAYVRFGSPERFAVLAVHLPHSWPVGDQAAQSRKLIAAMAGVPRERLVIAGDFNASPWSNTVRRISGALGVQLIGGEEASWPAPPSRIPVPPLLWIDHTLLGPGWAAARSVRGPALGSDHYPFAIALVAGRTPAEPRGSDRERLSLARSVAVAAGALPPSLPPRDKAVARPPS